MLEEMVCLHGLLPVFALLMMANGAPVLADRLFDRWNAIPVDFGRNWIDGHPLFGSSKTWRGLLVSVGMTGLVSGLLGMDMAVGACFAMLAMLGDLSSSFLKRRLGLSVSSRARGLDTLPESVLPAAALHEPLGLNGADVMLVAVGFLLIDEFLSPVLYRLNIRKRPY